MWTLFFIVYGLLIIMGNIAAYKQQQRITAGIAHVEPLDQFESFVSNGYSDFTHTPTMLRCIAFTAVLPFLFIWIMRSLQAVRLPKQQASFYSVAMFIPITIKGVGMIILGTLLFALVSLLVVGLLDTLGFFPKNTWFCRVMNWHKKPSHITSDGCSDGGTCPRCQKAVMQDSQGNWF